MDKFIFGCPSFSFLSEKRQINILQLNYDCYSEIFSYLTKLEDKLNFARVHPQFREVLAGQLPQRYATIQRSMLKTIPDWEFFLELCGEKVLKCELLYGGYGDSITSEFIGLLKLYCPSLWHIMVLFVDSEIEVGAIYVDILVLLRQLEGLKSLTLTDAKANQINSQLQHFENLETLDLDGLDIHLSDDDFLQLFHSKDKLRQLSIRFGRGINKCGLINELPKYCPNLEHLTLERFALTFEDLGVFHKLRALHLILRVYLDMNDNLYRYIAANYIERLEHLELKAIKVKSHQLPHIVKLRKLKAFACYKWPSEFLQELGQLIHLECLSLRCCESVKEMSEQLMAIIINCPHLEHLKLGKHIAMSMKELEKFISNLKTLRLNAKNTFLLSLEFVHSLEWQEKLSDLTRNLNNFTLTFHEVNCQHCQTDAHSHFE
ncbi:uncharacterized protein Dwil_GK16709 [Drosophila willistoni]|uniref:F-box domain-containing protein n=1 Tax=Drosophila willistoni TaxID=7260 RepID=B4MMJ4_DROWI|nr:uncharacterized protein LOC6638867 [Drosophila willistoni]EDW73339.1 uncharacterized protein Dwil_GK16709 [Drosophila willistoni]